VRVSAGVKGEGMIAATKRVIMYYSEFCSAIWSAEAKLQPLLKVAPATGSCRSRTPSKTAPKKPLRGAGSSARQQQSGLCRRDSGNVARHPLPRPCNIKP